MLKKYIVNGMCFQSTYLLLNIHCTNRILCSITQWPRDSCFIVTATADVPTLPGVSVSDKHDSYLSEQAIKRLM